MIGGRVGKKGLLRCLPDPPRSLLPLTAIECRWSIFRREVAVLNTLEKTMMPWKTAENVSSRYDRGDNSVPAGTVTSGYQMLSGIRMNNKACLQRPGIRK